MSISPDRVTSFPKSRMNVLLLENIHPQAKSAFEADGFPVETISRSLGEEELADKIKDVFILGIRSGTKVTPRVLENARKLITVGAYCIGTEQIDLEACSEAGVAVFNDTFSNTRSVAELALGEMIMLMRGTFQKSTDMHQGIWDKSAVGATEVRGKKLGIIGYGSIGKQLSVLAEGMGMEVGFYNTSKVLPMGNAKEFPTMDDVLERSDIISVHVSGKPTNEDLFSEREFARMKDGAVFLNLSRGKVVDLEALAKAITSGKISGAAIDVYPEEPEKSGPGFVSPLQGLRNTLLTPHVGGSTAEAQEQIGLDTSKKQLDFVNTGSTIMSVNMPAFSQPIKEGTHRFLHFHRNVYGVTADVATVLKDFAVNIAGSRTETRNGYGYSIYDVTPDHDKRVEVALRQVPNTIRFRPLY